MRDLPVARRANLMAVSTPSAPGGAEIHLVEVVAGAGLQLLRHHAAQERRLHLHQARHIGRHHIGQRLLHDGMVAPDAEHPVARQHVEVFPPRLVPQIGALPAHVTAVEADDAQRPGKARVDMRLVERMTLARMGGDDGVDVERHGRCVSRYPRGA
jgi:hypothetical protein